MSEEDQNEVIGRTVTEYAVVRKKLASLLSEASRMGEQCRVWAHYLRPGVEHTNADLQSEAKPPEISHLPTREQVETIVRETLAAIQSKRELRNKLTEYGIDLKD